MCVVIEVDLCFLLFFPTFSRKLLLKPWTVLLSSVQVGWATLHHLSVGWLCAFVSSAQLLGEIVGSLSAALPTWPLLG